MTILEAEKVYGEAPILKEPRIIGDWVLWLEQRPNEKGRTTALIRPWRQKDSLPQELTPHPIDLRTKFHGYGGDPLTAIQNGSELLLTWVDNSDSCLWTRTWTDVYPNKKTSDFILKPKTSALCLSKQDNSCLAGGVIDQQKNIWIGLMENEERDYIVSYSLTQSNQNPKILYSSKGLLGYLALNPKANQLAWIEWQKSVMPWDFNELKLTNLDDQGNIFKTVIFNSDFFQFDGQISFFNPVWSDNGDLYVAEDRSGWWNILKITSDQNSQSHIISENKWSIQAEVAFPQWVLGMSSFACVGNDVVGTLAKDGSWRLAFFRNNGSIRTIDQPFNEFSYLNASQNRLVSIASGSTISAGILEIDLSDESWDHSPSSSSSFSLDKSQISVGESFWFNGSNQNNVHSWYYPPVTSDINPPPLLVKSHSGPTGMAHCGLDMEVQFWTSRGWAVVDVNYGGSTGFGRKYRDRLKGNWGVTDVLDCTKVAKALIKAGKANKDFIAIIGSSASGFTALNCLCNNNLFGVAACKYALCDLISMSNSTHRFEEFYLDYLIGNINYNYEKYIQRSPINNVDKINTPLILFHGLKDKVILSDQSSKFVEELSRQGSCTEIHLFNSEGHGFKDGSVKVNVLKKTEAFFRKNLNI